MSGYCGTCGNTMCVCGEIEKERGMSDCCGFSSSGDKHGVYRCDTCGKAEADQGVKWTRPTSTTADMGKSAKSIGCSDGGCLFRHNTGQVTNGGCNCVRGQATHTGDGWTIPVQRVQLMIASAVRVALIENARAAREGTE